MADDNFQERTERATPRRRDKARDRGQVAKSQELNSSIMVILGVGMIFVLSPYIGSELLALMRHTMSNAPHLASADPTFFSSFADNMARFFTTMAPVFGIMVIIGFATNVAQVGFKVSTKAIEPKLDKLDLVKGLKKLFSVRSLVMLVRDSLKLGIIGYVAFKAVSTEFESFFMLPDMSVIELTATMGQSAIWVVLKLGAAMLCLSVLDYAYQKYEFEKSIKMSKQELKDEYKDTEGSPQLKSRIRQVQRDMARKRMISEVPKADLVLTNPTHIAIALKYKPNSMDAPYVLAKGERLLAEKIKEIAKLHGIPIIEDKPLARALFKMCDIGEFVPQSLYRAVAEVLAYVYRLKGKGIER